jgi:hypothetical protein
VSTYAAELGARKTELCGGSPGPHYEELTKRATQAFPQYTLPYMVQYSVYGLVNALACAE